jgi:HEAT repeat protein
MILLHELTHVTRKDLWWAWLRIAVESFTFFHPLVRIARHQWNLSQEMACDEAVVTRAQVTAPSYQNALLKILEQGQHQKQISNNLLAVGASGSFRDMKERIIAMNRIKTHGPLYQIAVAALIAAIGLTGVIPYQLVAKSKKDSTTDSKLDSAFDDLDSSPRAKDHNQSSQHGFNEIESNDENNWDGFSNSKDKTILSPVIQGLAEALKSNQAKVRRRVVEALSELEDPAAIPVLIEALKDSNKEVRHEALHGLEKFDNSQAIDAVAELLNSDSWKVRNQALEALEDFNHPKAIDAIIKGLKDPHHKNRLKAIDALEGHDHEVPIDVLNDSIHDDHWEVRREVIEIFGESGSPEAIKPLLHALADRHPEVRDEAFEALEELNLPDISAHVEDLIEIQPDVYADHAHKLLEKVQKEKAKKLSVRSKEMLSRQSRDKQEQNTIASGITASNSHSAPILPNIHRVISNSTLAHPLMVRNKIRRSSRLLIPSFPR